MSHISGGCLVSARQFALRTFLLMVTADGDWRCLKGFLPQHLWWLVLTLGQDHIWGCDSTPASDLYPAGLP